jgi:copper chaperone
MSCLTAGYGLCFEHTHEGFLESDIMNQIFTVEGMTCGHCEKAVTKALLALDAQAKVVIDRAQNKVQVESEQAREALARAIADEGYRVDD